MCDALADLFIGDTVEAQRAHDSAAILRFPSKSTDPMNAKGSGEPNTQPRPAPSAEPTPVPAWNRVPVDLVLVGHLPVRASAWSRAFIAQQHERESIIDDQPLARPPGMIRVVDGYATAELFLSAGLRKPHGQDFADGATGSIDNAITLLQSAASRVYVRYGRGYENALAACPAVEHINILTGADDAALVAAFRVLKVAAEHRIAAGVHSPLAALRLVVCGAQPEAGHRAMQRLCAAMQRFADAANLEPGTVLAGPTTLGPVPTELIHEGELTMDPRDLIELLAARFQRIPTKDTPSNGKRITASDVASDIQAAPTHTRVTTRARREMNTGAMIEELDYSFDADPADAQGPRENQFAQHESPRHESQHQRAVAHRHASMPGQLVLPGMRELQARCPHTPDVLLATDDTGVLHLVIQCSGAPAIAVESLAIAHDWAHQHAALLRLTPGAAALSGEVTQHLLTTTPHLVRRLLDGDLRVYATTPGEGAGTATGPVIAIN